MLQNALRRREESSRQAPGLSAMQVPPEPQYAAGRQEPATSMAGSIAGSVASSRCSTASQPRLSDTDGGGGRSQKKKREPKEHGGVAAFLLGWLPKRAPPEELVKKGYINQDHVPRTGGSSRAGRKGSAHGDGAGGRPGGGSSPHWLFGNALPVILQRPDTKDGIPAIVRILMGKLLMDGAAGLKLEGIFRVPGDAAEMQELRRLINEGGDAASLIQACDNLHSVAGLLKMFYRELSEPLLSFGLYDECIRISAQVGAPSETTDVAPLRTLLRKLPPGHFEVLRCLMLFLGQVVRYTSTSKMNVGNTAAVFAPNLLRAQEETIDQLADTVHVVNMIAVLIQLADRVFDVPGPSSQPPPQQQPPPTAAAAAPPQQHAAPPAMSAAAPPPMSAASHASAPPMMSAAPPQMGGGAGGGRSSQTGHAGATPRGSRASQMQRASAGEAADGGAAEKKEPAAAAPAPAEGKPQKWYYVNGQHQQEGPVMWPDLQAMFRDGRLPTNTYVYTEGMSSWTPAKAVDQLLPNSTSL